MPGLSSPETNSWFTLPEPLRNGFRIGWLLLFIGLFLLAMWRVSSEIFKWLRRKLADMSGAEFEPVPGAFRADFFGLLKRIRRGLLGLAGLFLRKRAARIIPEIASVRQIYRQFLRWATAAGFPRQPSQTPHEYLYKMVGLLPEMRGDLDFITQQYTRSRYGARRLTEDELSQLRRSWYNVKRHRLRKSR
jgi:hypothetical protein